MAERFGAEHEVSALTISDAIRIIDCNHPGFTQYMRRRDFHVGIGYGDDIAEMPPHHLFVPRSRGDFHLVPAIGGSKQGGLKTVFSIIVGGALLATGVGGALGAFAAPGVTVGFATGSGILGLSYGTLALVGAGLFLGGLGQVLAPQPKTDTSESKPTSFTFDGPGEIDDEGGPIHLILGEVVTGPIRIASSIESSGSGSLTQRASAGGPLGQGFAYVLSQIKAE